VDPFGAPATLSALGKPGQTIPEFKRSSVFLGPASQRRLPRAGTARPLRYPLGLVAVSLTVAAYTMRLFSNTLYVNDLPATQV
jgi:hypothetical protein